MSSSMEAEILEAVIEGDEERVNTVLAECLSGELPQLREQAVRMITMIDREQERRRRGLRTSPPCPGWESEEYNCTPDNPCTACWHSGRYAADTGEINIIRGRE